MADCPVGQPQELEKLIALKRFPNVFVKISHTWSLSRQPYPWLDSQELVKRLYHAFGPRRLMWGTDWLIIERVAKYEQALTVVRDDMKFLNADDKSSARQRHQADGLRAAPRRPKGLLSCRWM